MTSTRILARRRLTVSGAPHKPLGAPAPQAPGARRRRRTRGFVQVASAAAAERLHLSGLSHAYFALAGVVVVVLFYLALAGQITQASYEIAGLQDQQRQLIAEQDQLRYQEVTLHAPAQVQQQAAQSGMQRVLPTRFVTGRPVAIDLGASIGASPQDDTPLWMKAVAAVVNTAGNTRDVMAATNK